MNWKLLLSTFALIFLAELGDKTQLAAMARAATGEGGKWTVFAGASLALVLSTLLAVLFGTALTRVLPERYIKIAAGVLFLLFGVLILMDVARKRAPAVAGEAKSGPLLSVVLKLAAEFEEAAWVDYRRLAGEAKDPALRALLDSIAREEAQHLERVRQVRVEHGNAELKTAPTEALPGRVERAPDAAGSDRPLVRHILEHEQATAQFYAELARATRLPALKRVFAALADEERGHLARIRAFADGTA